MALPISFIFAGLEGGNNYCFEGFQRFALDIANGMSGSIEGGLFNMSESEPDPDQRDRPWLRLVGGFPDRWYVYAGGAWVWPNPRQAGGGERIIWIGAESDLWSYDGGDGTDPSTVAPTATTGAMWKKDTTMAAQFPIAVGTLPSGTVISPGSTGGAEDVELTLAQIPEAVTIPIQKFQPSGANEFLAHDALEDDDVGVNRDVDDNIVGGGEAHNNMPPYYGVIFAVRTNRTLYVPQ